jgi:hypothetical protein
VTVAMVKVGDVRVVVSHRAMRMCVRMGLGNCTVVSVPMALIVDMQMLMNKSRVCVKMAVLLVD